MAGSRHTTFSMVAFVDLLGYSARVQAVSTEADLAAIERDVRRVQGWFDHRSKDEAVRDVQRLQAKKVLAFSDCLVIAVPSASELAAREGEYDVLMSEVVSLGYAQGRCAVEGVFLWGGVDHGLWFKRRDTIISPALVNAYELERSRAVVPIMAVSDRFIERFGNHPQRRLYSEDDDPFPRYFREVELPDGRRQWIVDYLALYLGEIDGHVRAADRERYRSEDRAGRERMRAEAHERRLRTAITAHRDRIRAAHAAATTDGVRLKYVWLGRYHDETLRRSGGEPPEEMLVGELSVPPAGASRGARARRSQVARGAMRPRRVRRSAGAGAVLASRRPRC